MARVFNEAAWKSDKVFNIQPVEWRAEYAWVYSIALADGTFEASPRLVWMAAYASVRPDWDIEKVGHLLDELARVGLLRRTQDEQGKVWGRWVGSEKFLPSQERCKTNRYKTGRGDLFSDVAASAQRPESDGAAPAQRPLGVGSGCGCGIGEGEERDLGLVAPKNPETEPQVKDPVVSEASSSLSDTVEPTPKQEQPHPTEFASRIEYSAACHKAGVLPKPRRAFKGTLSEEEYSQMKSTEKTTSALAEWAAELAARPSCPGCGGKHPDPSPACTLASTTGRKR
jgi:hypothetical protein